MWTSITLEMDQRDQYIFHKQSLPSDPIVIAPYPMSSLMLDPTFFAVVATTGVPGRKALVYRMYSTRER